jgi:cellulose synthase/poly-beta-1,6-N-acetylglucosamine synthase-like glycosyltransferase
MLIILAIWGIRYLESLRLDKINPFNDPSLRVSPPDPPRVSIVVAARNEERVIERCMQSLVRQRYPNYEVIVADDRSTDSTAEIVKKKFPSVRCIEIPSLPSGYAGKSHALWAAQKEATGEWLLFTDADTIHSEDSILAPLNYALKNRVRMLTLLSQPLSRNFWEKVIQPITCLMLFMLFRVERINRPGNRAAFANGQYILIHRSAYDLIGGHGELLAFPLEDIAMAQNVKRKKLRFALLYGGDVLKCRMYSSFRELWRGWERIFFLIFSDRIWLLPAIIAVIIALSLAPYAGLFFSPRLALAQLILIHLASERAYAFIHADRRYIFAHPLGCAILIGILWSAFWKKATRRGVVWKGKRYYRQNFLSRK